jgi:hypothetical protein
MTVQLCDRCGRVPVVVGDRAAYSVERGNLIVGRGYCQCRATVEEPRPRAEADQQVEAPAADPDVREALEGAGFRRGR